MYEKETNEEILKRMLGRVPSSVDKREGSVIFDAAAPAAIEFELLYAQLDYFLRNTFGDTADREYLIERAKERGLTPYAASAATVKVKAAPDTVMLPIGSRYSYDDVNYRITENLGGGEYEAVCETAGTAGNKPAERIIPIDYTAGLQTVELTEIIVPGEDEEETEAFRARYLASFGNQAYGGNIADYRNKVNAIPGVGGVKVYPVWNGGGTVRLVFMTSEYKVPQPEFVEQVQTAIDPTHNQGEGIGIAPIGHTVTVEGCTSSDVSVGLHVTFDSGTFEDHRAAIEAVIDAYFTELNAKWQDTQKVSVDAYSNTGLTIRISQIESRILDLESVTDIQHTTLNGQEENLTLDPDALAVRGAVTNGTD